MNDTKGHTLADAAYGNVKMIREYMDKTWNELIKPVLIRSDYEDRDTFIKGLFLRALGLLKTLEKLNQVSDTQTIIATNRSLLEITVDILFLHRDKTNQTGLKMYWWGQSEKLKGAEQIIQYYNSRGLPVPQEHEPIETFYKQEKLVIEDMRGQLWPNSKKSVHPDRWSGKKLRADIQEIDPHYKDELQSELRTSLEELYVVEYRQASWSVHSGMVGQLNMNLESFQMSCAMAFLRCADLGMLCTKLVLKDFGLVEHLPNLRDRLDQVNINRLSYFIERAKQ